MLEVGHFFLSEEDVDVADEELFERRSWSWSWKVHDVGVGVAASFITAQVVVADDCLLSSASNNNNNKFPFRCVSWPAGFTPLPSPLICPAHQLVLILAI